MPETEAPLPIFYGVTAATWPSMRLAPSFALTAPTETKTTSPAHYNFVRLHGTTRVTPAMAAGVEDRLWTLEELVEETGH